MTISSLIAELQKLQALHGDLPVTNMRTGHVTLTEAEHRNCQFLDEDSNEFQHGPHIHLS